MALGCCADKGESDTQLRHEYILSPAFPVLRTNANAAWLTVGDLYYGFDACSACSRGEVRQDNDPRPKKVSYISLISQSARRLRFVGSGA